MSTDATRLDTTNSPCLNVHSLGPAEPSEHQTLNGRVYNDRSWNWFFKRHSKISGSRIHQWTIGKPLRREDWRHTGQVPRKSQFTTDKRRWTTKGTIN